MSRALIVGTIAFLAGCNGGDVEPPRHLVLITIDTLRADHLGCYGYWHDTSPSIDRLAAEGVLFKNAFSPRGQTFPAIATLFTGRTPIETCALANGDRLPESANTLAERLREAGFRTAAFSANKLLVRGSGIEQGFEHFFHDGSEDRDEKVAAAAAEWIASQDAAKGPRLFAWIHLVGPHLPYDPKPLDGVDFSRMFTDPDYRGEANGSRAFLDAAHTSGRELSPEEVNHVVALYDGEIVRVDRLVGRLVAACSKLDALLVLTADHGEDLYERNYFGHSKSVYDSVLHVPLILRHAPVLRGFETDLDLIVLSDLFPVCLERLGVEYGAGSAKRRGFGLWRDRIFTARDDRWRLVWNPDRLEPQETPPGPYPIPEVALFDHTSDPHELTDVSAAHPDVVVRMKGEIERWRKQLHPCTEPSRGPTPAQIQALKDLGYAGEDR